MNATDLVKLRLPEPTVEKYGRLGWPVSLAGAVVVIVGAPRMAPKPAATNIPTNKSSQNGRWMSWCSGLPKSWPDASIP